MRVVKSAGSSSTGSLPFGRPRARVAAVVALLAPPAATAKIGHRTPRASAIGFLTLIITPLRLRPVEPVTRYT